MVDSKPIEKPANFKQHEDKVKSAVSEGEHMSAEPMELRALSSKLCKLPGRQHREVPAWCVDALFDVAAEKMKDEDDKKTLANLRKCVAQVEEDMYRCKPKYMDAFFFPNKKNVDKIVQYIGMARKELCICVFNITNDDLANAIIKRHQAGVHVRVISDDECAKNKGNDIQKLADAGIEVRTDDAEQYHMHDKFMVVDHMFVLTGSFNWTFQAGSHNQENVLVVDHPYYCEKYDTEFNKLWTQFSKNEVDARHQAAKTIQKTERNRQQKNYSKAKVNNEKPKAPVPAKSSYTNPDYKFVGW